jgi:DNA-binding NarL/FixJ family response regulator
MSRSESTVPDAPNPYDASSTPALHDAWRDGFVAGLEGDPIPPEHRSGTHDHSNAWINGYTAAQLSSIFPAPMPADPESSESSHLDIYVVDDHPAIRRAVGDAIDQTMDLELCGQASTAEEGFRNIERIGPDVAVIDISLPDGHGLDLLQTLQAQTPEVATVVFSMYDETVYAERAIQAGASGYVMKTESPTRLLEAVRAAANGRIDLSQEMSSRLLSALSEDETPDVPLGELTDRELEVFELIGQGLGVEAIEERLHISRKTVETHRRHAKEKLGLESIQELQHHAVQWAQGDLQRKTSSDSE